MKLFLSKIIFFSVLFFFLLFVILGSNRFFSKVSIDSKNHLLVLGHSHSECAFNDTLINGLVNYSQSGESYFYTYAKIKLIVDSNPQIDRVFIEFSNNQIDKKMDDWVWGDECLTFRFPMFASFMETDDFKLLLQNNRKSFVKSLVPWFQNNINYIFKRFERSNEIGAYLYLERQKVDSTIIVDSSNSIINKPLAKISESNILYLQKIISYCRQRRIKIFLVRSPQHENYAGFENEVPFQNIRKKYFSTIEFLDFAKFPLPNDKFGDLEHLNHKGAKIFSIWFNNLLNNGLLEKSKKQDFIDDSMTKL